MRSRARHAERTERSGGLVPPIVTRTRPRQRRGIQIPDERVSLGPTPLAPTIQVVQPTLSDSARTIPARGETPEGARLDLWPNVRLPHRLARLARNSAEIGRAHV